MSINVANAFVNTDYSKKDAIDSLVCRIDTLVRSNLAKKSCIGVAYSGGLDSSVLLALVHRLNLADYKVVAIHVNHNIHTDASKWQTHCAKRCKQYKIELNSYLTKVTSKKNLEDSARKARQKVFRKSGCDAILLAHHYDDQIETVLLRMFRGAGVRGLAAMQPVSKLQDSNQLLLRPLLDMSKQQLRQVAKFFKIKGISDSSNQNQQFNRNWLRNKVIPQASKRFPGATQALGTVAQNATKTKLLLDQLASTDEQFARTDKGINRKKLMKFGHERVANWLAWRLEQLGARPARAKQIQESVDQIFTASKGFSLKFGKLTLVCKGNEMYWDNANQA